MIAQHPALDQLRVENILSALGNPIRLRIARILAEDGELTCGAVGVHLGGQLSKSTLTHHWRVLRDAGVIRQQPSGRENLLSLRREELEERYPGLLSTILDSAGQD
ncbi:ArsR/SmtB family transcription factor [Amycolatopsis australiensis]|uniref:DNA-binding transcriptional regulator, ArsR family n=1 Tax=Amycolatopsis australiensis TaxID=546364 RepID=A0A1K1Q044_9PSEU|nr:helix-turn-helix domain-containing protein [Amycolatopsis australiensis]SFW53059.1 DNA-binding transcriptional regulator, ArsR family [Amycolatopsis australiensis]